MSTTLRTIISLIIALICMAIIYVTMPTYSITPKGIVLPSDGAKQPFHGEVKLYTDLTAPLNAKVIGKISIEYHDVNPTINAEKKVIAKAKYLAAKAGGNGLIIRIGQSIQSTPSFLKVLEAQGSVIKTN